MRGYLRISWKHKEELFGFTKTGIIRYNFLFWLLLDSLFYWGLLSSSFFGGLFCQGITKGRELLFCFNHFTFGNEFCGLGIEGSVLGLWGICRLRIVGTLVGSCRASHCWKLLLLKSTWLLERHLLLYRLLLETHWCLIKSKLLRLPELLLRLVKLLLSLYLSLELVKVLLARLLWSLLLILAVTTS